MPRVDGASHPSRAAASRQGRCCVKAGARRELAAVAGRQASRRTELGGGLSLVGVELLEVVVAVMRRHSERPAQSSGSQSRMS